MGAWPVAAASWAELTGKTIALLLAAAGRATLWPSLLLCCGSSGAPALAGLLLDVHHDRGCSEGMFTRARAGMGRQRPGSRPLAAWPAASGGAGSTGGFGLGGNVGSPALFLLISVK